MPFNPAAHRLRTVAALATVLCSFPAVSAPNDARQEDGIRLLGGIGWAYDDNIFRVADDEQPFEGQRSDSYRTLDAGIVLDKTISRQRIAATAKVSKVKFDHFDQLDYDGRDLQASWLWQAGKQFEGRVEALYIKTLAPYTDFDSDERNLRRQRRQLLDAGWKLHPSWKLRVGAARDKYTYELLAQRYNDRTEKAHEVELQYRPKSGSTVGLVARRLKGNYPYRRPYNSSVLTDDFTQDELKARVDWLASGSTTVQALVGYARRDQPSYDDGRTSGVNGRVTWLYKPQGKVSYGASLWREFAPIESARVSTTLNKGASLQATWLATDRIRLDARAAYEKRDYTARDVFAGSDDLTDAIRSATVRASWQVRPKVQVIAGYAYESRTGSQALGTGKFDANMVQLSANVLF